MRLIWALLVALTLLIPPAALAGDWPRRLAHYTHQRWTEGSEAPAPVLALEQGHDGFLWLATGEGLFRFDGMGFERIEVTQGDRRHVRPSALLVTRRGDVWTNFEGSRRFAIYRHGTLRLADGPPAPARIVAMAEGADGAIWALTALHAASLLRFSGGRWQSFDAQRGVPRDDALSLMVARDGAIWLALSNSVVRLAPGAERFELVRRTPRANGRLSQDGAGRIWLSESSGSHPISGPGGRGAPPRVRLPYQTDDGLIRGAPMFDRRGNLWIATRYGGVQRVASPLASGAPTELDARRSVESFGQSDGLSSDVTYQMLEDREGNVWVGSEKGLDKLRPATLRFEPTLTKPAAFGDKLMAASDGSVYIGQSRTIYRVRPGGVPEPILRDVHEPQSVCEAPNGAIWIGFASHVLIWKDGTVRRIGSRPSPRSIIYDCAFDGRGDFWISAAAGGIHRYREGRWQRMFGSAEADNVGLTTMVSDARKRLVLQWDVRSLALIEYPRLSRIPFSYGKADPDVLTLYASGNGDLFAGGAFGLSRIRGGKVDTVWAEEPSPDSRIKGLVQTPRGDLWIAYPKSLVRLTPTELDRAIARGRFARPLLALGLGSGMTSRSHSMTQRSLVQGGDGRLWIATETGTMWMDPDHIVRNTLPPGVTIRSLTADGRSYRDPASVTLAAATSKIEIDYAALSFADPKHVSVRYRLDGYDGAWLDPGARREAFYTNLPPGRYRFRIIAANDEGVWNRAGAEVDFEIPPTFLQSRWFLALCVMAAVAFLTLLYQMRMAQVASRMRARLEERLGERERIARELHDTLLQSVQGLILRFQSVANKMPDHEPARAHLETALSRADEIIADGRHRVQGLRMAEGADDLPELLRQSAVAAGFDPVIPVRIIVEGKPRAIDPLVAAEISRIAGEALFNVARHARATVVEVTVHFAPRTFGVEIRDDGVGIPDEILAHGRRPGHFGLLGMRERAERIGGAFSIQSRQGIGSAVTVTLRGRLAYVDVRRPKWLGPILRHLPRGLFRD